jgi:predicted secreted protein
MSNAFSGVGTLFRRWSGTAWVNIAEVNSISGPSMTRETIDVTSLDSTGGYREFIAGFRDAGTLQLTMNFTRSTYDTMKDDFEDDSAQNYEIVLPDDENTTP